MNMNNTFVSVVKAVSERNASDKVDELIEYIRYNIFSKSQNNSIVRHLEALGFRFEGFGMYGEAARIYDLIDFLDIGDRRPWKKLSQLARVLDFIFSKNCEGASEFLKKHAQIACVDVLSPQNTSLLLSIAWEYECRLALEQAVQCYCLAFECSGNDNSVLTRDGSSISSKIRSLRLLQMGDLARKGRHEEAAVLHEKTRTIAGHEEVKIFKITSAKEAAANGQGIYRELLPCRKIREPEVNFLDGPVKLTSEAGSLDGSPQYVSFFKDCLTFPRSNLVIHGDKLIYDLAAHPRSNIAEIRDGVNPDQIMQAVYGDGRALVEVPATVFEIDTGLMLFGFQSRNYGHWLLEFVPKVLWFNDPSCPSDLPFCIDDHMPETHEQIIQLLDERDRKLLKLPPVATQFRELGLASVPAFFPFDFQQGAKIYDTIWPEDIFREVRVKILDRLNISTLKTRPSGRRIFLSRKEFAQRRLVNEDEIINTLLPHGFEVIYPEKLNFAEQIDIYHSSDLIIGSASSALTNCIFCHPRAKVIALIHENLSFNFRGYASMIGSSGAKTIFVRGNNIAAESKHDFHFDFYIEPALIHRILHEV